MTARPTIEKAKHRSGLEMICPYEPGKPIDEVRRELGLTRVVKLASNENPLGPSPRVIEVLNRSDLVLGQYPDYNGWYLREDLSRSLGVSPEQIMLGAGSAEVILAAAYAYLDHGDEAIVADLSFPVYENASRTAGATPVIIPLDRDLNYDLDRMLDAVTGRTQLVFIASPNNPTGRIIPLDDLCSFVAALPPRVLCVVDLAYWEYIDRSESYDLTRLFRASPNLVVLRTFSKAYGLAGLRIGYGIASPEAVEWMSRVHVPFSTSSAAQLAARVGLQDKEHIERSISLNAEMRQLLMGQMAELGLHAVPSQANFVLVDLRRENQPVFVELLRRGVITRPIRHPRLSTCLRITTGTREQMELFIGAMREILDHAPGATSETGSHRSKEPGKDA